MKRNIKNSSGKITGYAEFENGYVEIYNFDKPVLRIEDIDILKAIEKKTFSREILEKLYNEYTLSISEIACLYDTFYSRTNRAIKECPGIKPNRCGRRNRAFGHPVSKEQSEKMSKVLMGRKPPTYERTPEIRAKIAATLRQYYKVHPQNATKHRENWKNGVYDKVDFKRGIAGHFTSIKNNKTIRFRSLLELYYLILLEEDNTVFNYLYEPFHIEMENGDSYMPDFLINNSLLVELKPKKFVERVKGVKEKVEYKKAQAIKYCEFHGLSYKIVYDEDIGFESQKMKHYIRDNPEIMERYNVSFMNPERVVTK